MLPTPRTSKAIAAACCASIRLTTAHPPRCEAMRSRRLGFPETSEFLWLGFSVTRHLTTQGSPCKKKKTLNLHASRHNCQRKTFPSADVHRCGQLPCSLNLSTSLLEPRLSVRHARTSGASLNLSEYFPSMCGGKHSPIIAGSGIGLVFPSSGCCIRQRQ